MKWSDLTLKERKQIYDAVRAENPNASYFDIKSQFDSIPGYEDGKDNSVAAVYSLPEVTVYPQNKFGDIARTQGYETAKNWQTVRNATTAGINEFVNDPRTQMVLAAVPMPSGIEVLSDAINIGKSASKSKQLFYHGSPVRFDKFDAQFIGSAEGGSKAMKGINLWYKSPKNAPKFANIKSPDAPIHLGRSSKPLGGELNPTVYDVVGTDLNLYKTESNRVKGLLQSNLEALKYDGIQGKTIGKNIDPNIGPTIGNYQIQLDPQQYVPGTGSHELSHVVDQLAGDVIKNRYLNFLADSDNIMSVPELEKKGIRIPPKIQFYLSDPQEAKAHMIQLKHAMLNSGKINNWSQKVTQQELEDFLFDPLNTQLTGSMNKLQYKMYRNKSRFLDRFNRVNPLAIGAPIGLAATNNKDKQSN